MTQLRVFEATGFLTWFAAVLCLGLASGCGKNDIRVYTIPKEKPSLAAASDRAARPQVRWQLPAGWEEREPGGMRLARFAASGKEGEQADIAIIPLGAMEAPRDKLVNIWREQIHLPPLEPSEIASQAQKVEIGSAVGELFELVSAEAIIDEKSKARTYVAVLTANQNTWIFKMSGHDAFVAQQKPEFTSFLKSITFEESSGLGHEPHLASTNSRQVPMASNSQDPAKPLWQVPPAWQEQPPTQMLLAKFIVSGTANEKAEVTVSAFPGDMGGMLANVNRWRGQVGLDNIAQSDLSNAVTSVDLPGGKATLLDVVGTNPKNGQKARLIGAIIPRDGKTWFFKMMGDDQLAGKEKPVFVKFIQTMKFPDA